MKAIETTVTVTADAKVTVQLPEDIPPGGQCPDAYPKTPEGQPRGDCPYYY